MVAREPSAPMAKKACPLLDSRLHDSIVDVVVKSLEQIHEVRFMLNWNKCQKLFCGGGNLVEKVWRNLVRFVVYLRDATSAMTLNILVCDRLIGALSGMRTDGLRGGEGCWTRCRRWMCGICESMILLTYCHTK